MATRACELLRFLHQFLDPHGSVERGILGVQVEMDEFGGMVAMFLYSPFFNAKGVKFFTIFCPPE